MAFFSFNFCLIHSNDPIKLVVEVSVQFSIVKLIYLHTGTVPSIADRGGDFGCHALKLLRTLVATLILQFC